MERGTNQYKGLKTDISYDSIGEGFYIEAINMRISATKGESQSAITNFKGNEFYFTIPQLGTGVSEIIGVTYIRNVIIFFVASDSPANGGWIYKIDYDEITGDLLSPPTLLYTNIELNFSKAWPIEALGRYESDCIKRVYWTDYNNYFRSINIEDPDLATTPVGLIDIFPNIKYTQPLLIKVLGGGQIKAGSHQYAYRLLTFDGKQSLISPPGNVIHCTSNSETLISSARYNGMSSPQNTFKAHEILIDTSNYGDFEFIELINIYFVSLTETPEVSSVEIKTIGQAPFISFIHNGSESETTPLETFEYATKQYPFKTFKTLTSKDNSLIPANIKGSDFDAQQILNSLNETFDAKTYRTKNIASVLTTSTDEFNQAYNKDAHWDADWHNNQQYRFRPDGVILGGMGAGPNPNVSYKFHLEPYIVDGNAGVNISELANVPVTTHDLGDGYGNYANTTFDSPASPFLSGLLRGYKRGETYRFGIIFYSKKGESSFVEHIGDIKFPDLSEEDGNINNSSTNYFPLSKETFRNSGQILTTAYALGIEFTIDFTTCPGFKSQINSFQIVRLKRTVADARRLTTGIIKIGSKFPIYSERGQSGAEPASDEYDLSGPTGSHEIVHLPFHTRCWGKNGNFAMLNDYYRPQIADEGHYPAGFPGLKSLFTPPPIHGSYIHFQSADISFNFPNIAGNTTAGDPFLLITGRYAQYYSSDTDAELFKGPLWDGFGPGIPSWQGAHWSNPYDDGFSYKVVSDQNFSEDDTNLGEKVKDHRRKMRTTGQIQKATTSQNLELIKKLVSKAYVNFDNFNTIASEDLNAELSAALGPYPGVDENGSAVSQYFRNFYAYLDSDSMGLNDHKADSGNDNGLGPFVDAYAGWHKGVKGIVGTISKVTQDPYTGALISTSAYDWFDTGISVSQSVIPDPTSLIGSIGESSLLKAALTSTPIVDILIPKIEIYGGFTQNALETNNFIPASPVLDISLDGSPVKVFGGDIFLPMFVGQEGVTFLDDKRFYQELHSGDPQQKFNYNNSVTNSFVTETRVNTELSFGGTTKTVVIYDAPGGAFGHQAEVFRQETKNKTSTYGKPPHNMYTAVYNLAYSVEPDSVLFFIRPDNFKLGCTDNDLRAFLSNVKSNEESIDSWTKFGINNFYDVDDYGPINKVANFKDEVYFIQDRAIGKYSINPRAIVSTEDGIPTELGSGEGFKDHTYITTEYGAIHQWATVTSDSGIYYYDGIHKKIFKIGSEDNAPLSEVKGIHSLLSSFIGDISLRKENDGDNPILGKGVHVARDKRNNEVLFTFLGIWKARTLAINTVYTLGDIVKVENIFYLVTTTFATGPGFPQGPPIGVQLLANSEVTTTFPKENITLAYDEIIGEFSSFYTATPSIYIENGDLLLSPEPSTRKNIYQHNKGNFGEFYGVVEESSIKLVLNQHADMNKVLRFIEFNSIVRDDNKNIDRTQTITGFRVETEYQDTGKQLVDSGRIKRKFDKWRLKVPRDQNNGGTDRLRSTHFILTLYFDNTYNKELILNKVLSYFDIQVF